MHNNVVAATFAAKAREFCEWCESSAEPSDTSEAVSRVVRRLIAALYLAALDLPHAELGNAPEGYRLSSEERKGIWPKLKTLPLSYYRVFFNPSNLTEEPVLGDLTDDMEDIYADLKEGLWLFEQGHPQAAVWQWRFSFESHWAHHATDALHALQAHTPTDA